ncbi:hypothetical protein QR680_010208 [Steinernema hermaphroditum]|uniref:ATP-dependent DNA helicase n=1 Tax=Steinernema hermaphroditum TaxID=289476 RepID=A0AA39MAT9_9BILA|nr:hypothetical protein QR680_010208 [Steinernema hermaphroditum]
MSTSEGESTPSTSTKRVRSLRKRRSEVEVDQEREERRQANAQKKREYQARQRATETEEQRRTRLDKDRDRHRQMRAEKKKTAFHIQEPEHLPDVFYLGKRDKRCTFCGALHFVGFHNCCREGRIFINPMKKLWEPLQSLYFNEDHPNRGEFLNKILQYNTLLSMASSQHDRVLQNPFGVQSVKVRGSVHHMPSTLYPENLSHPRYGNVYIYDVNRATEYRMNEIIARDINEDILKELGQQPMIDALCYPLIHAYGEDSWRPNIPYISCSDEMNYVDRMVQVKDALLQQGIEIDWTIEVEEMELIPRGIAREIAEIESLMHVDDGGSDESDEEDYQVQQIAYHSDSDEDPDEDEHEIRDEHRNDAVNNEELHFVERNGELYPHRDTVPVVEHEQRLLADYVDDSGDDENPGDQEELLHQISLHPTAAHDTDNIIEDVTNEEDDMVYDGPSLNEPLEDATQSRHPRPKKASGFDLTSCSFKSFREDNKYPIVSGCCSTLNTAKLYVIDHFMRITRQRGENIRRNNTQTTITNKKRFLEFMNDVARRRGRTVGALTYVPHYIRGSPRYLREQFEKAVTLSNKLGKPDLFITFTASSRWQEIKENIPPGETWADHPFLVAEIFKKKLHEFLKDVCGTWKKETPKQKAERIAAKKHKVLRGGMFGDVAWYVYSVEFQQRGMPHAHIVISLAGDPKTKVAQKIDEICQAELPVLPSEGDPEYRRIKRLRDIVEELMMHSPCENNNTAYCRQHTKRHWRTCSKRFPKPFRNFSSLLEDDYALLRRPDNGECSSRNPLATNQYVVAYNKKLLLKYEAHINVEIISNLHVLKYLFKYLFKGFNRALIETVERTAVDNGSPIGGIGSMTFTNNIIYPKGIKLPRAVLMERNKAAQKLLMETMNTTVDANNQDILVYDEVSMIEDMRAATSCEAAWEVSAYGTNGSSHSVFTTYIHAPDEETVIVPTGHEEEVLHRIEQQENELPSMLKAWFKINSHPPAGTEDILRDLTFCDMPKYFKYQNKKWVKKARPSEEHVIGRIKSVHPRYMEKFAIRLLAMNRKFMKSFEDLRTVDGIYYDTFVDAAKQLGLMTNEMEWQFAMQEACDTEDPINIRRLFASILIFCVPANPRQLWDQFKIDMYDRRGSSDEQKEARALFHIRSILLHHNRELVDFDLPDINESQLGNLDELNDDGSDPFLTSAQIRERAKDHESKLNDEQKDVFNAILRERSNIYGNRLFFLNGSGGCGKTFLYRALYYALKASGHNVLCTAHTGVAATLLPNGATVHRSFGIPITAEEQMESQISLETTKAEELSKVDVILWDEATMSDRRVYNCVDRLLRALHEENSEEPFGGVMIIAGGDWKQTLPIVKEVRNEGVLSYTLKKSTLWQRFVQFHLKTNMRAIDDPAYADLLLKIGQGDAQLDEDQVEIPQQTLKNTEDEVINFVFPYNEDWSNRSILTVTNEKSLQLCEMVLNNHPGEARTYESVDKPYKERSFISVEPETYHTLTPPGLPPHRLRLKKGCEVMLLRNLNVKIGLCNGTRLKVLEMKDNLLICAPVNRTERMPEKIAIHRIPMSSSDRPEEEFAFIRHQYPLRLSYSLTINKAQGQSLDKVGLVLPTSCFAHGQLYVALSRAHKQVDIAVTHYRVSDASKRFLLHNIVYKDILQ